MCFFFIRLFHSRMHCGASESFRRSWRFINIDIETEKPFSSETVFGEQLLKGPKNIYFFFFGDNNNTHFVEVITGARFVVIFSFFSFCFSLFSVLHFLIDKIDMIIFDVCFFSTNVIEREEKEKTQIILNCGELSSENRIWSVVRSIRVDLFFVVALCANRSMNRNHKSKAHNLRHEQKRTKHEERMNKSSRKKKEKK